MDLFYYSRLIFVIFMSELYRFTVLSKIVVYLWFCPVERCCRCDRMPLRDQNQLFSAIYTYFDAECDQKVDQGGEHNAGQQPPCTPAHMS